LISFGPIYIFSESLVNNIGEMGGFEFDQDIDKKVVSTPTMVRNGAIVWGDSL